MLIPYQYLITGYILCTCSCRNTPPRKYFLALALSQIHGTILALYEMNFKRPEILPSSDLTAKIPQVMLPVKQKPGVFLPSIPDGTSGLFAKGHQ
jgi:hypothetical protein